MGIFRRKSSDVDPSDQQLLDWHLVLLPEGISPERVNELVASRYPDANLTEQGRAQLGRQSALSGPFDFDASELAALAIPPGWTTAYAIECEPERDAGAYQVFADAEAKAWWMRAFPQGKPFREEGDAVDLGLALARRLGGRLRVGGTHEVLAPDPEKWLDLTVWTGYWLAPEHLLALLEPVLAGVRVDFGGAPRPIPQGAHDISPWSVAELDPLRIDLEQAHTPAQEQHIRQTSEAFDRHAWLRSGDVDGYSLNADGDILIEVIQEELVPDWIRDRVGSQLPGVEDPVVTHHIRWVPPVPLALESEDPPYSFRTERDRVRTRLRSATLAIAEATAGVVTDTTGFEVDRYDL